MYFVVPPQLAHYCKLTFRQLLCWGPAPTRIACRISFRNSLCWGPTRIEKSLLQAHFRSVNYCQYNFVEH
ncbi:hypothetical protein BUZ90_16395 [Mammaliicoccus sciuri]|nr:hypothetical protein BUZ90_16395 [Mammaliicoccus sciuri]